MTHPQQPPGAGASPIPFRKIAAVWLIAATVAVLQSATQLVHMGANRRAWALLALTFVGWLVWAPLTPPIIRLTRRYPLERGKLAKAVAVHLAAAFVFVTFMGLLWEVMARVSTDASGLAGASAYPGYRHWRAMLSPVGNAMVGFVTYGCIVGAVTALDAVDRSHRAALAAARLARDVAQAREQAIKMQVHPHFLFNTLHAVSVLITEDPRTARAMVVHLGDFLRATLARASRAEVTLREELELLTHYLDVERLRFGDRLAVDIAADEDVLDAYVPDLVLQPLAENAIKHGVSTRPGANRISVRAARCGQRLVLTVEDEGGGSIPPEMREGIGLRSTRRRLAHLYGDDCGLTLAPREAGGARATVTLPFHLEPLGDGRAAAMDDDDAA
ncbi:MAG TPA: histidine kinase [Longimicrobiaceae bacterium]|nr:histidine kinase [Longimicrobiaceae bacterium]